MLAHSANGSRRLVCVNDLREIREIVARTASWIGVVYLLLVYRSVAETTSSAGQGVQSAVARDDLYLSQRVSGLFLTLGASGWVERHGTLTQRAVISWTR